MKQRIFYAHHIRQIAEGVKTEKREPCKNNIPPAQAGDIIRVKEAYAKSGDGYVYMADNDPNNNGVRWLSAMFMPQKASRYFLEVVGVSREPIANMTIESALAEGITMVESAGGGKMLFRHPFNKSAAWSDHCVCFADWWNAVHPKCKFDTNPDVWVIKFKLQTLNKRKYVEK